MKSTTPVYLVIMGVSGCGKTTVGEYLAPLLGLPYLDGDDLHPQANIEKMTSGHPLNDEDRWPWLEQVGAWLEEQPNGGIIGCSALKRSYRDVIRRHAPGVQFVHLAGDFDLLYERINSRPGHFMKSTLLQSQFDTLEDLEEDEAGMRLDVAIPADELAQQIAQKLKS